MWLNDLMWLNEFSLGNRINGNLNLITIGKKYTLQQLEKNKVYVVKLDLKYSNSK